MVDLSPSRKDITTAPRKDGIIDLSPAVRRHDSYLESLDPGILRGRFATPRPPGPGTPLLVGGDAGGDGNERLWEYDDRGTVTVATGTQLFRLSHEPFEESLVVRWHPRGRGGLPVLSESFTVEDQTVIITDPGILAVGDEFSFQYEYEETEDALELEFIAAVLGVFHYPANILTFTPPPEMQEGDFLVLACRGASAPGGGDLTFGFSDADARTTLLYTSTPPVYQAVFVGTATSSYADVTVTVVPNPSYLPGAVGVMGIFRGVNNITTIEAEESSGITPQVEAAGAIAVTWFGNVPFGVFNAPPPTGYTDAGATGIDYASTDVSYFFDAAAEESPAGTYSVEGVLIIGVT
jgi:hypothetical protein